MPLEKNAFELAQRFCRINIKDPANPIVTMIVPGVVGAPPSRSPFRSGLPNRQAVIDRDDYAAAEVRDAKRWVGRSKGTAVFIDQKGIAPKPKDDNYRGHGLHKVAAQGYAYDVKLHVDRNEAQGFVPTSESPAQAHRFVTKDAASFDPDGRLTEALIQAPGRKAIDQHKRAYKGVLAEFKEWYLRDASEEDRAWFRKQSDDELMELMNQEYPDWAAGFKVADRKLALQQRELTLRANALAQGRYGGFLFATYTLQGLEVRKILRSSQYENERETVIPNGVAIDEIIAFRFMLSDSDSMAADGHPEAVAATHNIYVARELLVNIALDRQKQDLFKWMLEGMISVGNTGVGRLQRRWDELFGVSGSMEAWARNLRLRTGDWAHLKAPYPTLTLASRIRFDESFFALLAAAFTRARFRNTIHHVVNRTHGVPVESTDTAASGSALSAVRRALINGDSAARQTLTQEQRSTDAAPVPLKPALKPTPAAKQIPGSKPVSGSPQVAGAKPLSGSPPVAGAKSAHPPSQPKTSVFDRLSKPRW
jgi:hypothetical protein